MAITLSQIAALTADASKAVGYIDVATLPAIDDTLTVNGQAFTFKTASGGATEITIGGSVSACATNIATILNASVVAGVALATYTPSTNRVAIQFDAAGAAGAAFTLATSVPLKLTLSGATLSLPGGGATLEAIAADLKGSDYEKAVLALISVVGAILENTAAPNAGTGVARKQRNLLKRVLLWLGTEMPVTVNQNTDDRSVVSARMVDKLHKKFGAARRDAAL